MYSYDDAGNIIQKETFALTSSSTTPTNPIASAITYVYTQNKNGTGTRSDRLKWVGEHEIEYDTVGNPIEYYNGASYAFTWQGRQLASATKNGGTTTYFTYSDEGLRTAKSRGTYEVNYYYSNGLLIGESNNTETILYIYDAEGSPLGMRYRTHTQSSGSWTTYWFEKNMLGDIVAVYSSSGTKILSYKYDAWGNFVSIPHATDSTGGAAKNPFRYRGYYYDSDLGFYVTGTRYYDPAIGRFVNVDGQLNISNLLGTNLYAYCYNNPVMFTDFAGQAPEWNKFLSGALLATMGVITVVAVVSTGGSCVPIVAAAYSVLATSGVVATAVGASEVYESFTGDNPIREYTGESTYDLLKYGSVTVMSMGSTILEYGTAFSVCFVAGTLVKAENGDTNIENIEVGDLVYAHNPDTGETELKPVVRTFVNETAELVHIHLDGEEIICTTEHPFYSPTKGWITAVKLRAGNILVTLNGEYIVVEQVQHEILESPIKVYNFEVADFHTYFVGSGDGLLVHNTCSYTPPKGGGGVTDSISISGKTVNFGHGARHLPPNGPSISAVNNAIAKDVITKEPTVGIVGHGSVNVSGFTISYNYFTRSSNLINIGTYVIDP